MPQPEAEPAKPSLEEQKLELDRQRLALDKTWVRRWGVVLIPAFLTAMVGMVTAAVSFVTWDTNRTNARVQSDRAALEMYFSHVAPQDTCSEKALRWIRYIEAITQIVQLQALYRAERDCIASNNSRTTNPNTEVAIASGLPDLIDAAAPVDLQGYTGYIQYPAERREDALQLQSALAALGMRAPGIEQVRQVPGRNEVRFYSSADQESYSSQLGELAGFTFVPKVLGGNLPHGIIEFWLAEP